jgi:hypothetical protein
VAGGQGLVVEGVRVLIVAQVPEGPGDQFERYGMAGPPSRRPGVGLLQPLPGGERLSADGERLLAPAQIAQGSGVDEEGVDHGGRKGVGRPPQDGDRFGAGRQRLVVATEVAQEVGLCATRAGEEVLAGPRLDQ